jgi:hypothetical protein
LKKKKKLNDFVELFEVEISGEIFEFFEKSVKRDLRNIP